MKNVLILFCFSLMLGKSTTYNVVVVSPVESYLQKKQAEMSVVDAGSENSLQWKRRHKRRKKVRRPQRGR
tara:strand:- start:1339 stop:1548 length:210 start_codon:yes stop_codon:yes gene_type:complete